jgi:transposase InsO family protein
MERMKFIVALQKGEESMKSLCQQFGISRQTGYQWKRRFEEDGVQGLEDRPPIARTHPHATDERLVDAVVAIRKAHPTWGPKKIRAILLRQTPGAVLPATSTIGALLERRGMVAARKPRLRVPPSPSERVAATAPNVVWTIDHKGAFNLRQGRCYPLTLCDLATHYLLKCEAVLSTSEADARPHVEAAFREFGLPDRIRSDNGTPFASSQTPGGLTHLSIWWIKLGIRLERIDLGHPQQNGSHERLHRTLEEAIAPGQRDPIEQQRAFDAFRRVYNLERPHEALDQRPPAEVYRSSWRAYPAELADVTYPDTMLCRRVLDNGSFNLGSERIFLTKLLAHENVGLLERASDRWDVYFGTVGLGELHRRDGAWRLHSVRPTFVEMSTDDVDVRGCA